MPGVICDGRTEDFATEMIVIIHSPPTSINKRHLVDLEERVAWAEPVREFRNEGFDGRFPAKGQVERVARIQRESGRRAEIAAKTKG